MDVSTTGVRHGRAGDAGGLRLRGDSRRPRAEEAPLHLEHTDVADGVGGRAGPAPELCAGHVMTVGNVTSRCHFSLNTPRAYGGDA